MTVIQMRLATIGAVIAMVLGIIDTNVLATAVWPIATSLDPENGLQTFPWVITAYALAATVTQPLYGKLVDLHGPKRIFLFSLATFLIGSAACGLAQTMGQLIAFRAVQGVGGGGLMGVTLIMIMAIWPPEKTEEGGSDEDAASRPRAFLSRSAACVAPRRRGRDTCALSMVTPVFVSCRRCCADAWYPS